MRQMTVYRQASAGDAGVLIVHGDDRPARGVEERRGDGGPVSRLAVHPDLALRHLGQAGGQLMHGNVDGAADVGGVPFLVATDIQDDHRTV